MAEESSDEWLQEKILGVLGRNSYMSAQEIQREMRCDIDSIETCLFQMLATTVRVRKAENGHGGPGWARNPPRFSIYIDLETAADCYRTCVDALNQGFVREVHAFASASYDCTALAQDRENTVVFWKSDAAHQYPRTTLVWQLARHLIDHSLAGHHYVVVTCCSLLNDLRKLVQQEGRRCTICRDNTQLKNALGMPTNNRT